MRNKLVIILIIILVLLVSTIIIPVDKLSISSLFGLNSNSGYSALEVYSLGGDMKVFIDGVEQGLVSETQGKFEFSPITSGTHKVTLERVASSSDFYEKFDRNLEFVDGFTAVISWELGPTEEMSSGWILTAKTSTNSNDKTKLNIISDLDNITATLNNENLNLPVVSKEYSLTNQLTVKVQASDSQTMTFQLFPEDTKNRAKLQNYELFVYVDLFKIPIPNVAQRENRKI